MVRCDCAETHDRRRIVLTGGPGAGKTAVLELIRQSFCEHVQVLREAASVVYGGGFPREDDENCRRAAQRAIFYVQRELENAAEAHRAAIVLCDRGTVDGLAYWPGVADDFWASVATTRDEQLARYHTVIHLRTPALELGYNQQNPLRTESASVAVAIDRRIFQAWAPHPRRFIIEPAPEFMDKAAEAVRILRSEMPDCCRQHVIPAVREHLERTGTRNRSSHGNEET